jgi:1-acyl-sn-glycerol-3-phosphate acyltransferase
VAHEAKGTGPWWNAARTIWYPIKWLSGPSHFIGMEHVPATGPAIVVANHISYIDPIYTGVFFDRAQRMPRFLAKDGVFRIPVVGFLASKLEQIPVYRGGSEAVDSLREADKALEHGHIVLIYPEGTITRDPDYWPMRGRTGAARLALDHDVPVIPVVHWNTQLIYDHYHGKKYRPFPRKRVIVQAGAPIDLSAYRELPRNGELLRQVTEHIMRGIRDVLAAVRGEEPPEEFFDPARAGRRAVKDAAEGAPSDPATEPAPSDPVTEAPQKDAG